MYNTFMEQSYRAIDEAFKKLEEQIKLEEETKANEARKANRKV